MRVIQKLSLVLLTGSSRHWSRVKRYTWPGASWEMEHWLLLRRHVKAGREQRLWLWGYFASGAVTFGLPNMQKLFLHLASLGCLALIGFTEVFFSVAHELLEMGVPRNWTRDSSWNGRTVRLQNFDEFCQSIASRPKSPKCFFPEPQIAPLGNGPISRARIMCGWWVFPAPIAFRSQVPEAGPSASMGDGIWWLITPGNHGWVALDFRDFHDVCFQVVNDCKRLLPQIFWGSQGVQLFWSSPWDNFCQLEDFKGFSIGTASPPSALKDGMVMRYHIPSQLRGSDVDL